MPWSEEMIDCGPRVVRQDEAGYFVWYRGATVRSPKLEPYLGQKVHVVACLSGESHSISEWLETAGLHQGGWVTRAGATIDYHIPTHPPAPAPGNQES